MKKLALGLGGGASKGYAHIGVLKVLEDNGIVPSLIVGTSMGAIVGGAYACGKNAGHLIDISKKLTRSKLMDFNPFNPFFSTGIMSGKKLKRVLYNEVGDIMHEQLKIPFVAIATNILSGELVELNDGKLLDNMLASSAVPGIFPVVQTSEGVLCDGGLLNNVPDDIARRLKKDYIILSIDVIADYKKQVEKTKIKIMGHGINAITLMQTKITQLKGDVSDLRINISQPDISVMSFDTESIEKSINYGMVYMKKHLTKLKKLLECEKL